LVVLQLGKGEIGKAKDLSAPLHNQADDVGGNIDIATVLNVYEGLLLGFFLGGAEEGGNGHL
jgi:hypothetical protein